MKKNKAAQELAKKRHLSLTPQRRSEIASIAGKKSAQVRSKKKADLSKKKPWEVKGVENKPPLEHEKVIQQAI